MSGAAAAAAIARRRRQEEEEMTAYRRDELEGDWEFKILRSMTGRFRKPETLEQVLEEEGQAGWMLVEKFDDGRLRLKRPATARTNLPARSDIDPYRTYIGPSERRFSIMVVVIVLALTGLLLLGIPLLLGR